MTPEIVETGSQLFWHEDLLMKQLGLSRTRLHELMANAGARPIVAADQANLWHWLAVEAAVLAWSFPDVTWTPRRMRAALQWIHNLKRGMRVDRIREQLVATGSLVRDARARGCKRIRGGKTAAAANEASDRAVRAGRVFLGKTADA